jgi:hypothetical protein
MNFSKIGSERKRKKYAVRHGAAAKLIAAYVKLSDDSKDFFESFLALQVYGEDGMHPYHDFLDDPPGSVTLHSAYEEPMFSFLEPWPDWAREIREASLTYFERREAVRAMLGVLILHKDRSRLSGPELDEAAKRTLGWTRWDAKHYAWLRSQGFNSESEMSAWIEKMVAEKQAAQRDRRSRFGARDGSD